MKHLFLKYVQGLTPEQYRAFLTGYTLGAAVIFTELTVLDRRRRALSRIQSEFVNHVIEDCWVYLPPETKDKFLTEAKFFSIAIEETP